jgi:hypothetical protein
MPTDGTPRPVVDAETEKTTLQDNKAFAAWALFLVAGAATLITTLVLAGIATVPPLATLLTDIAMGLGIRAAYKQIGGWDWSDWSWSFAGDSVEIVAAAAPLDMQPAEELAKAA